MSGSTVGGVVGAVIGAYFGNAQLGWMIGSAVGGYVDPEVIEGPKLKDAQGVTAMEGAARPFGYGVIVCGGNIIQSGPLVERSKKSSGKGGPVQKTWHYYRTYAIRVCEGPVVGIRRIWRNGKLVYSTVGGSFDKESKKFGSNLRIYLGTESQNPDPSLEALPIANGGGIGNVPSYRGTCYIVVSADDLTDFAGAIPSYKFEVVVNGDIEIIEPNILPSEKSGFAANFWHEETLGARQQIVKCNGEAACIFRVKIQPLAYAARVVVEPLYSTHEEGFFEIPYGAPISGAYDSGWVVDSEISGSDFTQWMTSNGMVAPSYSVGVPSERTFTSATSAWGLKTTIYFWNRGGPAHVVAGVSVEYPVSDVECVLYPDQIDSMLGSDGEIYYPSWAIAEGSQKITSANVDVSEILIDLLNRAGVNREQVDTSMLTSSCRGFMVGRQMEAGSAIRAIQQGFFFDTPEMDGRIVAVPRGRQSVMTIEPDHVVKDSDDDETRAQIIEYPWKVNLIAPDPDANYDPSKQSAIRRTYADRAMSEVTYEVPIIFTRDENAKVVEMMQKYLWESAAGKREISLPDEYGILTPSDCVTLENKRWLIRKKREGDGVISLEMERDRASSYRSSASGTNGLLPSPPKSGIRGPTMFWAANLPRLSPQNIGPGVYVSGQGIVDGWYGYDLELSYDGISFESIYVTSDAGSLGYLLEDFEDEPLHVKFYTDQTIYDANPDQLASRANVAAISGSEIVQFKRADSISGDEYNFSEIERGGLSTPSSIHKAGATFAILDGSVKFVPIAKEFIGKTIYFRPVSLGTAPENNPIYPFHFDPMFLGAVTLEAYTTANGVPYTTSSGDVYTRTI